MTGPWKGAGASIGEGLAMFTQSFIQRQDQLKQQQQQEQMYQQQLEQQRLQNERQREQMDLQARQQQQSEAATQYNRERTDRLDALGQREDELTKVLSPQVNTFMQGVQADLQRYAPTLSDGRPNPQYNPALFEAAQARSKQAKKLWSTLSLSVGAGQGYEEAKQALLGFVGGDVQATPTMPAPVAPVTPAPTVQPVQPAAQPATLVTPEPRGAVLGNAPETPEPAPVAPVRSDLPANITQIAPSQLMELDDSEIQARYGQGGLEYANAARQQYAAQVQAQQADMVKFRQGNWVEQLKKLDYSTMDGTQLGAVNTVNRLLAQPSLDAEDEATLRQAFADLAPAVYTAETWADLVKGGDWTKVLSMLPVYQKYAPQVVAGFDPEPFVTAGQSQLDKDAAAAAASTAAARNSDASANRTNTLLPGEVAQQGADLTKTQVDTAGQVADTAQTQQATRTAGYDLGVKKLSQIAGTGATVYQIQQSNPGLWYELKQSLNVNDAGLTALLQQARYEYNQGVRGKDLENTLKAAQITNTQAQTGNTLASTQETLTLLPGKAQQQAAQTALTVAQTSGENADTARTLTLTPLEAANTQAQTAGVQANTALSWARIGEIQQNLKLDREKTAAYIKGVEGNYAVDMARVGDLTASTALKRAENPNDPLYNPVVAASKPGDPIDALKKKAGVFYTQADQALKQANSLNTQINGLVKQGTGITGTFDRSRLSPADQQKLDALTKQRDALFKQAQDARQKGDNVFTQGMGSLGDVATPAPTQGATQTPFKRLTAAPNVKLGGVSTALVNRMDNMLAGFTAPGGLIPVITQGVRTKEEQDALYAKGRTTPGPNARPGKPMGDIVTNAKGGESNHNGGAAVDISWKDPKTGKILSGTDPRAQAAWKALGARAPQFGLRWGGTFPGLMDMYHFEVFGDFKLPATATTPAKPISPPAKTTSTTKPAAAPAKPVATTTGPLKAEASVSLIKAAPTPQALAAIRDRLVAGGMTAEQATAYIRKVKTGS